MKIIEKDQVFTENTIITIGNFDGIHLAHKSIINFLIEKSQQLNLKTLVFTFENHPEYFFKKNNFRLLTLNLEKNCIFETFGIDYVYYEHFDLSIASQTAEEFILNLISKFNMKALVIGDDNTIGKNKQGNFEYLSQLTEKLNFKLFRVNTYKFNNQRISSSLIRQMLFDNNLEKANEYLGHKYFIISKVISGKQIGRKLGYPTANILVEKNKLLPSVGVYAVMVDVFDKHYLGMCNIGYCPTFRTDEELSFEVNIFNFDENIYLEKIKVLFLKRIRNEKRFDSVKELIVQLEKDKHSVINEFQDNYLTLKQKCI